MAASSRDGLWLVEQGSGEGKEGNLLGIVGVAPELK